MMSRNFRFPQSLTMDLVLTLSLISGLVAVSSITLTSLAVAMKNT
jgi:hypothetical protein